MVKRSQFLLLICFNWLFCLQAVEARKYDEVIESGYIEIAVYNDFPPYSYQENGKAKGIDVEVGKLIAAELGVEPRWFWFNADETLDDDLRNAVWKGHYLNRRVADVMMRVPYDPVYSRLVDGYGQMKSEMVVMFGPYHQERWLIARDLAQTGDARTLANFQYMPIGAEIDTLPDFFLTSVWRGRLRPQVKHYSTTLQAIEDLKQGKLAAVMGTRSQLMWGLATAEKPFDLSKDGLEQITHPSWDIGLAVKHTFRQLSYAIEEVVANLTKQGKIQQIFADLKLEYETPKAYQY